METKKLISFHNDPKIKELYLDRVKAHAAADEIVKGVYWEKGKGCAVGCTIHSENHNAYETELGIPEWLARVEDTLFEGMSLEKSKAWPRKFLEAIPVGADLEKIKGPFLIIVLERSLTKFDNKKFSEVTKSIKDVIALWKNPDSTLEEFDKAAWDAADAARAAARDAADAAADAAWAAADAARAARAAAAAAAAAWAARAAEYEYFADELLKLLKTTEK